MWLAFEHLNFIEIVQIIIGLELAFVFTKLTHDFSLVDGLRAYNLVLLFDVLCLWNVALWIFMAPVWISRFDIVNVVDIEISMIMS